MKARLFRVSPNPHVQNIDSTPLINCYYCQWKRIVMRSAGVNRSTKLGKNDSIIFQRLDGAGNDRKSLKRPQSRVIGPQSDHDFSSGLPFCGGSYSASLGCYVRFPCALSARRLSDLHMNRTAKSSANHLLRTARPTFIKARVPNQDCQIVPTPIMPQFRARWTTRDIVAANLPQRCNVLQYPEF